MKLYFSHFSTTSLGVVLFCAEANIEYEPVLIDLMKGEHKVPAFLAKNPFGRVPVLEDDDFVLTESSAILKYLADRFESPAYPRDLRRRARVNERMDWINADIYRELGYHLAYPQLLPHHARDDEHAQVSITTWGKTKAEQLLEVLDRDGIGTNDYLCGSDITIADYFAAELLHVGSLIGASYTRYPRLARWHQRMRALPSWPRVNAALDQFAAAIAGKRFVTIGA